MAENVEVSTKLKIALFESVRQRLAGDGFELKAARDKFVRQHAGFSDSFQLACKDAKPGYRIQPNVGVRIDLIEDIFHQTSGFDREFQDNTSTMGAPVGALLGGSARDCEFLLESESWIPDVTEKIIDVFRTVGLPYYDKWKSLPAIDAELNGDPARRTLHRGLAWFRCSTGLIVAKLVGRRDYATLADIYTEIMTQDNKGFYLKRFQALKQSLNSVEPSQ
jgi:hypothetical protein